MSALFSRRHKLGARRQFAYAAEADPNGKVAKRNLWMFSGGFLFRRAPLVLPLWLILRAGGPSGDAGRWAVHTAWTCGIVLAIYVAGATAIRYAAARDLPEGPRRFIHDEARRQRWRFWLVGGVVAVDVLIRWLAAATPNGRHSHVLLLLVLVTAVSLASWQTAGAARRRYAQSMGS